MIKNLQPPFLKNAIKVGVTGHRSISIYSANDIIKSVQEVLTIISQTRISSTLSHNYSGSIKTSLLSPLATGSDQLVAEVAIKLGIKLICPLPLPIDKYTVDFEGDQDSKNGFFKLIKKADSVLELDGSEGRPIVYENVGRFIIKHSDIIIAIWDGEKARGKGGTAQIVAEAQKNKKTLIIIPPNKPKSYYIITFQKSFLKERKEIISDCVLSIIEPWSIKYNSSEHEKQPDLYSISYQDYIKSQLDNYRTFCSEKPIFIRLSWRLKISAAWYSAWNLFIKKIVGKSNFNKKIYQSNIDAFSVEINSFKNNYIWVDQLSKYYATLYRSTFVINYLLGALSVSMALLSYAFEFAAMPLIVLELICITVIVATYTLGKFFKWHDRAVEYRTLSEMFRQMIYLSQFGITLPLSTPQAHSKGISDLSSTWIYWHFCAVNRSIDIPSFKINKKSILKYRDFIIYEWITPQINYHKKNNKILKLAYKKSEKYAIYLFISTALACLLHLILHHYLQDHWINTFLIILAAGLPAWAAAIHGIRGQGEFERLSERSNSMCLHLKKIIGTINSNDFTNSNKIVKDVINIAQITAGEMMDEVNDWQVLYRAHPIPLV